MRASTSRSGTSPIASAPIRPMVPASPAPSGSSCRAPPNSPCQYCRPGAIAFTDRILPPSEIVPNVNRLARATRAAGGAGGWIQNTITPEAEKSWSVWFGHFAREEWGPRMRQAFTPGDFGHALYPGLDVAEGDLRVRKTRFSALIQGSSDLDAILRARGIDTLIVVGTATNVCCESTARDAMMLNYKVFFVSDANACRT